MDIVERLLSGEDGLEYAAAEEIKRLREALFQIAHQRYGATLNAIDNYNELQAIARAALATGERDE